MPVKCAYCGKEFSAEMPFRCKYCGKEFCSEHRLPESHECTGLETVRERVRKGEMPMFPRKVVAKEIKPNFSGKSPQQLHYGLSEKIKRFLRKLKFW